MYNKVERMEDTRRGECCNGMNGMSLMKSGTQTETFSY